MLEAPTVDRSLPGWQRPLRQAVRAMRNLRLSLAVPGKAIIGKNVSIGRKCTVLSPQSFIIGDNVRIGQEFFAETNVEIGPETLVSSRVSFVGDDHPFDLPGVTVFRQQRNPPATVRVEGDTLIGHGCILVGEITLGRGVIVGAGSVVTTDLPAWTVCAGVPARPLRMRRPPGTL
jgi:chloramphenicol O-acetyltransferase type B